VTEFGNACYRSVQNLLSSHLLSKNVNIITHKTIILSVVLYGCGTWSLTLRDRLRVLANSVLERIFGSKRDEVTGGRGELRNEELHSFYSSPIIIRLTKSKSMRWAGHVARMGRRGMHIRYWWESHEERDHWEHQ
jgi:hypothetical protein